MHLPNSQMQAGPHRAYLYTGAASGAAQLILPEQVSRSMLLVQNLSDTAMYLEIGSARATAALTSGVVSSCTVTNGGFGFTVPPTIEFVGGLAGSASTFSYAGAADILAAPGSPGAPTGKSAIAHAVLTGGVVSSIVVDDGGSGYVVPPLVLMHNSRRDPFGCADPFFSSAVSGVYLAAGGGSYYINGTVCPTDSLALYCSVEAKRFTVKWMA